MIRSVQKQRCNYLETTRQVVAIYNLITSLQPPHFLKYRLDYRTASSNNVDCRNQERNEFLPSDFVAGLINVMSLFLITCKQILY